MTEQVRAFIAIGLPDPVKDALAGHDFRQFRQERLSFGGPAEPNGYCAVSSARRTGGRILSHRSVLPAVRLHHFTKSCPRVRRMYLR